MSKDKNNFFDQFVQEPSKDSEDNFFMQFAETEDRVKVRELLRGPEGPPGLNVKGDEGGQGPIGPTGPTGPKGASTIGVPGDRGIGIASFFMRDIDNDKREGVFVLTDGRQFATGNLIGEEGKPGDNADAMGVVSSGGISLARFNGHAQNSTIHFTEASISHLNIQDIGSNNHAAIDTHLGSTNNPHGVTFTQAVTADPNTDITAAEAETLTDGSDADSLHTHKTFDDGITVCGRNPLRNIWNW